MCGRVPKGNKPFGLVKVRLARSLSSCYHSLRRRRHCHPLLVLLLLLQLLLLPCASCWLRQAQQPQFDGVQVYISPAKKRYRTYKLANAAFISSAAPKQQCSSPTFELGAMVTFLRDVVACRQSISCDAMEMAMLAGVLRARRLLSSFRAERLAAMRA